MSAHATSRKAIHRLSSLGRALEPSVPSNRVVLVLMPAAALAGYLFGAWAPGLADTSRIWAAASGAAVTLGAWALGRELAPDDQRAAFLAMALGVAALAAAESASLVLLFTTLALTRMVNRSVGLPARVPDVVAVLVLTAWSIASTRSLGVGIVAAGAFALDALLPGGLRRQWGFSALALVLVGTLAIGGEGIGGGGVPGTPVVVAAVSAAVLFLYVLARTRAVDAIGDATGTPLSARRVRWGMTTTLAMAIQAPLLGEAGGGPSALLWACIAGVAVSGVVPPRVRPAGA